MVNQIANQPVLTFSCLDFFHTNVQAYFNPLAFTICACTGLAVFPFKALKIPCVFAFSGGKTQKCKYSYVNCCNSESLQLTSYIFHTNCCNSESLQLTSYIFHTMYLKTLHYSQMLINVYEINVLTVKI